MGNIKFNFEISNPDLVEAINKLIPHPIYLQTGDIVNLNYNLKYDTEPRILDNLDILYEIIKDPKTKIESCQYLNFSKLREFVVEFNTILEKLNIEIASKLADNPEVRKLIADRISDPDCDLTVSEEVFVEAVLKANQ